MGQSQGWGLQPSPQNSKGQTLGGRMAEPLRREWGLLELQAGRRHCGRRWGRKWDRHWETVVVEMPVGMSAEVLV